MSAIFSLLARFYAVARKPEAYPGTDLAETRNRFFIDLSHELKTPLAIIRSNWEILAGHREGDLIAALSAVGSTTDRMARMVDGFLAAARLDFSAAELHKTEFALADFLEDIHDDCVTLADNSGVHLTWASDDALIIADRDKIKEVVLNLISNALKHTDAGGAITLSGKAVTVGMHGAGGAEIVVCDTGSGIPPGDLPHIFERFYRIRDDGTPGTGLGLHICQKIVEAHGGRISVESKLDEGTRFVVFLP